MDRQQPATPSTPANQTKRAKIRLNDVAFQLTLKWIERSSDVAELAVNDVKLAETQAIAVGRFFNTVRLEIAPSFGKSGTRSNDGFGQAEGVGIGVQSEDVIGAASEE